MQYAKFPRNQDAHCMQATSTVTRHHADRNHAACRCVVTLHAASIVFLSANFTALYDGAVAGVLDPFYSIHSSLLVRLGLKPGVSHMCIRYGASDTLE